MRFPNSKAQPDAASTRRSGAFAAMARDLGPPGSRQAAGSRLGPRACLALLAEYPAAVSDSAARSARSNPDGPDNPTVTRAPRSAGNESGKPQYRRADVEAPLRSRLSRRAR